jgi:uncharacterized protein (UPF0128 family)
MDKYFVLCRKNRKDPIELLKINSEYGSKYVVSYLRGKGYRVLLCGSKKNIELFQLIGKDKFMKMFSEFKNDEIWCEMMKINVHENVEIVE